MDNVSAVMEQSSWSLKNGTQTMTEFGNIWVTGYRNIFDIYVTSSRLHIDHINTTLKAISDVRTIRGAIEMQMSAARVSIDQAVDNTSKLSTALMELAEQGMAPIKARMDTTVSKSASI